MKFIRHSFIRYVFTALAVVWLVLPPNAGAFALFTFRPDPSGFSDIVNFPSDHGWWDLNTITWQFSPSFLAAWPHPAIQEQVRQAFRQWDNAVSFPSSSTFGYNRARGWQNFGDFRSVAVHELGHVLGYTHTDQAAPVNRNYRGSPGSYSAQPAVGTEVMRSWINPGDYNRILSQDELQAYRFNYGGRDLNFVEIPPGTVLPPGVTPNITLNAYTAAANNWANGGFSGVWRSGDRNLGVRATSGGISFNRVSGSPMGMRTKAVNWDYANTAGGGARAIQIATSGTDSWPLRRWNHSGPHTFANYRMDPITANDLEWKRHVWTNPGGGSVPAGELLHVGLELDVWDWRVTSAEVSLVDGRLISAPLTVAHEWNRNLVTGTPPSAAPMADGLSMRSSMILARGFELDNSAVASLHSRLAIADVTGMGLRLEDLTRAKLNELRDRQKLEFIENFGERMLLPDDPFIVVLQGDEQALPREVLQSGNYLILNRPDLVDRELFVYLESRTDEAMVGSYSLIGTPPIVGAAICCAGVNEIEPNDGPATATLIPTAHITTVAGSIKPTNDMDYFAFNVPRGARLWATVDTGGIASPVSASRDSFLTIYDIDGVTPLERDDDDGSGNGCDSTLESGEASAIAGLRTTHSGIHFASVSAWSPAQTIIPYHFFLTTTTPAQFLGSEAEPNDTASQATSIVTPAAPVGVRTAWLLGGNDVDYYSVYVSTGMTLLHISADADIERIGFGPDLAVDLMATDGTVLFTANSSGLSSAANSAAEGFCYVLPCGVGDQNSVRKFLVRVRSAAPNFEGKYDLMVAACPLEAPALEIAREGNQVVISWPLHAVGFHLMSCDMLGGAWRSVPASPQVDGEHYVVRMPMTAKSQFFSLGCR